MKTTLLRIVVCAIAALALFKLGSENSTFGALWAGVGALLLIYGFSPSLAKSIINAIVKIVTAPFRR